MRIAASAPGKLVLLGEYAVLEGAPALVLAVNRRATATLRPAAGRDWEIASPTLGIEARLRFGGSTPAWMGTAAPELAWVGTVMERAPGIARVPACRVELETDRFYLAHRGTRHKLGLGSSAALTVALLGALVAVQTLGVGQQIVVDARVPALLVAAGLLMVRAPFLVVVVAAAVVAALLRLWGLAA